MLFEALDHAGVERIKSHIDVRQMADGKRLNPNKDLLQFLNRCLAFISKHVFQFVHSWAGLVMPTLLDCIENLRELFIVLLDKVNAVRRVLPVTPDVISTSRKLVVVVAIMLVHRCVVPIAHESNVLRHMDLLAEVLDVHSQVHDHFISRLRVLVLDQEAAGNPANNSAFEFEHHFNVLIAKELLRLLQLFVSLSNLLQLFDMLLPHERVMHLGFFPLLIKAYDNYLLAAVNTFNFADDSEVVNVKANNLSSLDNLLMGISADSCVDHVHRMALTPFHQHGQWDNVGLLLVNLVISTIVVIEFNALHSVASYKHVDFRFWAVNSDFH